MIRSFALFVPLFLMQLSHGTSKLDRDVRILTSNGNDNVVVDNLLIKMKEKKSAELDPYILPNNSMAVWYKFGLNFTGELHLHTGYLIGITTLKRMEDSGMGFRAGKIHVDAKMGIGPLHGEYLAKVAFISYGPTITIKANARYADLDMDLILVKGKFELYELKLYELQDFKIRMSGLGPINYVVNTWSSLITNFFKGIVRKVVEDGLRKAVAEVLKELV